MKVLSAILALGLAVSASYGEERYKDRMFDVEVENDVVYATDVNHLSLLSPLSTMMTQLMGQGRSVYLYESETDMAPIDLHMDIYTPKGDTEKKRAAVLVMHGGAFAAGSKDDMEQQSVTYCDSLAARGFVAIAVQYRLGITATLEEKVLTIDSLNFSRTVYRGIQDVRAAVRYVRSKASDLGIDKDRIYLLGNSAGAILALENIYMDKPSEVPAVAHDAPDLGELDNYGVQGENPQANAAVALWGGVHDPSIIGNTDSPVLLVHGTADSTVLFKTGRPLGNLANTLGVNMMMLKLAGINSISINTPTLYGSFVVDSVLKAKDVEHETYFVDDMPHEFYDEDGYGVKVREKVFAFLYGLTQKPASTKVLAVATARPSQVRMGEGNMNFTVASGSNLPYAVMDLRGRTVMSGRVSQGEVVGLEALERGVYVLRVKGERPLRFGLAK